MSRVNTRTSTYGVFPEDATGMRREKTGGDFSRHNQLGDDRADTEYHQISDSVIPDHQQQTDGIQVHVPPNIKFLIFTTSAAPPGLATLILHQHTPRTYGLRLIFWTRSAREITLSERPEI